MLVLRRQAGESIHIGPDIEIRILTIGQTQVKIGVIAPRDVEVYRSELAQLNRRAVVDDWQRADTLTELAAKLRQAAAKLDR